MALQSATSKVNAGIRTKAIVQSDFGSHGPLLSLLLQVSQLLRAICANFDQAFDLKPASESCLESVCPSDKMRAIKTLKILASNAGVSHRAINPMQASDSPY
jgi:hypothetical protein